MAGAGDPWFGWPSYEVLAVLLVKTQSKAFKNWHKCDGPGTHASRLANRLDAAAKFPLWWESAGIKVVEWCGGHTAGQLPWR